MAESASIGEVPAFPHLLPAQIADKEKIFRKPCASSGKGSRGRIGARAGDSKDKDRRCGEYGGDASGLPFSFELLMELVGWGRDPLVVNSD